jgi:hypothetical protein
MIVKYHGSRIFCFWNVVFSIVDRVEIRNYNFKIQNGSGDQIVRKLLYQAIPDGLDEQC